MTLRQAVVPGAPMLAHCENYWKNHASLITCYADIRPFVEALSREDREAFSKFVDADVAEIFGSLTEKEIPYQDLITYSGNRMKLCYLLWISLTTKQSSEWQDYMEKALTAALQAPQLRLPKSPEGFIAIFILLRIHRDAINSAEPSHPFGTTPNSRVLLQAAMLSRHLVASDKEKQDRPLALLAARLHLNLGLGKCAFQLYSHTKCKEMLVHTLSPYVLSRISLTHPYGARGYQGFSAEEELGKAIGTMERMERKIEETVCTDLQSLPWDQAMDLLAMKRKFKSSLTKHICNIERRRIARLKGEPIDNLPIVDPSCKYYSVLADRRLIYAGYRNIVDNVDRSVFPNYEHSEHAGPLSYIMPNTIPDVNWLIESLDNWDASSRVLYRETQVLEFQGEWIHQVAMPPGHTGDTDPELTPAELQAYEIWDAITCIVKVMMWDKHPLKGLPGACEAVLEELHAMRLAMEKLRMPGATHLKPEDEPTMFHENMLISCYTKLEVLRAFTKMVEHLREKVINAKTHHMKATLPKNWVNDVESETKICFEAIRDVAHSYIKLIEEKGHAAIKAQIRWGKTGEALREVLSDEDVDYYATDYVDSALQAWKGVLQVKLK
jgi:N-terminal acetyltransferase B complex non-catalytic subunit